MTDAKNLAELFPSVNARILDFLIEQTAEEENREFTRVQIQEGSKVHYRSLSMVFSQLEKLEILEHTRDMGKKGFMKLYKLKESDLTLLLTQIKNKLI